MIPPDGTPGVNWDLLPNGAKDLPTLDGFRGWAVEFHNQISDIVVQDAHQALCNFRALLTSLKQRHPHLVTCSRETDGAGTYNSTAVALFSVAVGQLCGIQLTEHSHNEPGHGSDICDTAGANSVREVRHRTHIPAHTPLHSHTLLRTQCRRYAMRTDADVNCANVTQTALTEAGMSG